LARHELHMLDVFCRATFGFDALCREVWLQMGIP
jgi:hypothetical protein